jgi:hypothetical protein
VIALVRSELRKIGSTRLWWGLLVGALVYAMIQSGAQAAFTPRPRSPAATSSR